MAQLHEDVEWLDSELEDSPRSNNDDISHMFSSSPNAKGAGRQENAPPMQHAAAALENADNVERDMSAPLNGAQCAPEPASATNHLSPKLTGQQRFQDTPSSLVAEQGAAAKRALIARIHQESMTQLSMACQAVLVRGASGNYFVYHLEITSDYYKQRWVVCKRYSEFYRLRKRVLDRLAAHKKQRRCSVCGVVREQLKDVDFPRRIVMFKDPSTLVGKRTAGLEEFIIALCQCLSADHDVDICSEIASTRFFVKEFLQFPLDHERQHVRSIRQLQYVDPRDVVVDADACPICLCEWAELDGKQLVLSPCGHFFHEHCINEWYSTRFDCPICRTISGEGSDYSKSNY